MKNFGEIKISPEIQAFNPSPDKCPDYLNKEGQKSSQKTTNLIEHLREFYQTYKNPEKRIEKYRQFCVGLAITALSSGGYLMYDDYKNLTQKQSIENTLDSEDLLNKKESSETEKELSGLKEKINMEYSEKSNTENPNKNPILKTEKETVPSPEQLEKAHNLGIEIQAISMDLLEKDDFFPKKIFSDDYLLAIQAQESGFDKNAESHKGAVGSMQVMPETIREVLFYINKIDNRMNLDKNNLTDELVEDLAYLIKQNPSLGKAFGHLCLAEIFNNFEIGKKSLEMNWITLGRKKILAVYNWGIKNFMRNATDEENWPNETKNYIKNIFADMEIFKRINSQLGIDENNEKNKESGKISLKTDPQLIKEIMILEIRKFREDKKIDYAKLDMDKIINYYLSEIRINERIDKEPLKREFLKKLITELNFTIFKNFVAKEGLIKTSTQG